jgi:predicted aspartyl protease
MRAVLRSACLASCLALVALPAGADPNAAAGEPATAAVLAALPFDPEAAARRKIVVDLAPRGNLRRMPFQLDTGATTSAVSPRMARALGIGVRRVKGDAYRRKTVLGRDLRFQVVTRRSDTASNSRFEYGLLGGDFLSQYVVELDFSGRSVRFLDPKKYAVPASASAPDEAVLDLEIVSNRPAVRVSLGARDALLLLDTGAPPSLLLSGASAREAGIASAPVPGLALEGILGPVAAELGEVARLEIGPFAFEKIAAVVAPQGLYNQGFSGDSILGYDLLAQFLVRIDYPRQRLWLRRDPAAKPLTDPRRPEPGK